MTTDLLTAKDYEELDAYFINILANVHNAHAIKIGLDAITNYDKKEQIIPSKDKQGMERTKTWLRWAKCMTCNKLIGITPISDLEANIMINHGVIPSERTSLPYIKFDRK